MISLILYFLFELYDTQNISLKCIIDLYKSEYLR